MKSILNVITAGIFGFILLIAMSFIWAFGFYIGWKDGVVPIFQHYDIILPEIQYGFWVMGYLIFGLFRLPFKNTDNKPDEDTIITTGGKLAGKLLMFYVIILAVIIMNSILF